MKKLISIFTISIFLFSFAIPTIPVSASEKIHSSDLLLLINKDYTLPEDYEPFNSIDLKDKAPITKDTMLLREEAVNAYMDLLSAMETDGYLVNGISGYRSYSYQSGLFNTEIEKQMNSGKSKEQAEKAASTMTAVPGASEHQSGLAIDVSTNHLLSEEFGQTQEGVWLQKHAYEYGFILRYPKEKQSVTNIIYEPWHFRYVGQPHAEYMTKHNLTLEEYISFLQKQKELSFTSFDGKQYLVTYTKTPDLQNENQIDVSSDNMGGYIVTSMKDEKDSTPDRATTVLTRDKFVTLLDYSGLEKIRTYPKFRDVTEDMVSYESIVKAYECGILNAKNGRFGIEDTMTREETASALSQMIQSDRVCRLGFQDTDEISGWAFQDVQKLVALNIITSQPDNKFRPKDKITVEEVDSMIQAVNEYKSTQERLSSSSIS